MKVQIPLFLLVPTLAHLCSGAEFYSSGSPDIDRVRAEVQASPTTADHYQTRALLLFVWLGSVQQQSADTHPFFDIDKAYYQLQGKTIHGRGPAKEEAVRSLCRVVDDGYMMMEEILRTLKEDGPIHAPFAGDPAGLPKGGDMEADWPMFQGYKHNTVYPFGVHDIYGAPAICQNLNRLICADVDNDRKLWDFNVGDIDVLAGDGYVHALK